MGSVVRPMWRAMGVWFRAFGVFVGGEGAYVPIAVCWRVCFPSQLMWDIRQREHEASRWFVVLALCLLAWRGWTYPPKWWLHPVYFIIKPKQVRSSTRFRFEKPCIHGVSVTLELDIPYNTCDTSYLRKLSTCKRYLMVSFAYSHVLLYTLSFFIRLRSTHLLPTEHELPARCRLKSDWFAVEWSACCPSSGRYESATRANTYTSAQCRTNHSALSTCVYQPHEWSRVVGFHSKAWNPAKYTARWCPDL